MRFELERRNNLELLAKTSSSCARIAISQLALADKSMSRVGENEGRPAAQLACPALLTSQSRPPPGGVSSQPLLDEREASDCSVSFCIQVDEPPGRPFLLPTRNSSSRKSSEFDQGN